MSITKRPFGETKDGSKVDIFTLTNVNGITAEITNYGGIVVSLKIPDREGKFKDVVLGFDNLEGYLNNVPFFGAIIGRFANRIENASFEINGVEYKIAKNEGENHIHGGKQGFDKVLWKAKIVDERALQLVYLSEDGEEGYPGNLEVTVTYTLTDENELRIDYYAVTDKDTVINLTNHSYFNLSGQDSGDILNHKLRINADTFTANDEFSIPTGEIRAVVGTPMDFTDFTTIGDGINSEYDQLIYGQGYDHNWILNAKGDLKEKAAEVFDESTGRLMEVYTTKPGVQLYTGNFVHQSPAGKGGVAYVRRGALCLETQYYPNATKHKHFPSAILKVGEEYKHCTIYKFGVK